MTRYHVVTTMNAAGWEQTGRRMVDAFYARWPEEAKPITVYAEGFEPDIPTDARGLPAWLDRFKATYSSRHRYKGRPNGVYDYRFDGVKFAHKVAAMTDLGLSLDDGVMIWLDADTFTHADVDVEWLDALFPEPAYLAWLNRNGTHPETGILMFRCAHPAHRTFMLRFAEIYQTGRIFGLPEFHDCYALMHLAQAAEREGLIPPPASLSGDPGWHHPFVNGPLGARLDHLKGGRKAEGRSRSRDLRQPRSEPYWAR